MATFQTLPGFREFYPEDLARRNHIFRLWRRSAHAFGFVEYDAPVLEPLELYKAKSGDEIEGQLFSFTDKGGRDVALRPEMTPTVCRLVGAKANALKRPIKWYSIGEFYRYERAQKGRLRAFYQFNADIFGEPGPEAEAELIALLIQCLGSFGLTSADFCIRLSDRNLWFYYLEALGLSSAQVPEMLSAIDKFEKIEWAAFKDYETQFGSLDQTMRNRIVAFWQSTSIEANEVSILHTLRDADPGKVERVKARIGDWKRLLGLLEAMGLKDFIKVDLSVVRGLAYYTGFVFEAFDRKGDLRALAGGGRYDNLVEKLGYAKLSAVGFAIGDVTTALLLEQRGLMPPLIQKPDVFCVIDGAKGQAAAFPHVQALRAVGHRVEYNLRFAEVAFGKQFKAATESGARLALIYGGDEVAKGVVKIRDLTDRSEQEVPLADAAHVVQNLLGG
jgi:histidyl-tRNA synthetase